MNLKYPKYHFLRLLLSFLVFILFSQVYFNIFLPKDKKIDLWDFFFETNFIYVYFLYFFFYIYLALTVLLLLFSFLESLMKRPLNLLNKLTFLLLLYLLWIIWVQFQDEYTVSPLTGIEIVF